MLLGIPNETCAGLKKLSTCFGMRSRQKIANILCEWVTKNFFLAHQISSQYKVWMETAIRNTSNSFLQPPPPSHPPSQIKVQNGIVNGRWEWSRAKGDKETNPPLLPTQANILGSQPSTGASELFGNSYVLKQMFWTDGSIAEQFNQANRCRKARTFLHEEETNQSKMFQKN